MQNWRKTHFLHLDAPLFLGICLLSSIGLVVLYSASGQNMDLMVRQLVRLFLGFGIMLILAQIRIQHLARLVPWMYLMGVLLLILVLFIGETRNGSQRWLFGFQPSEIMKLAVPLMVAWYLADKPLPPTYGRLLVATIFILIP
ncbi:MAG: FtsW/RodA/SpoVE family cell cycle protein, partial [Thiomargarita sp.]|nr:FtsW/RodA/SpoVE family cell cycle protein [Thiomargarita sp.]